MSKDWGNKLVEHPHPFGSAMGRPWICSMNSFNYCSLTRKIQCLSTSLFHYWVDFFHISSPISLSWLHSFLSQLAGRRLQVATGNPVLIT